MARITTGIHRDKYGYRVCWPDRGRQREKRFPPDAPLDKLKQFRERQLTASKPAIDAAAKGLARDIVRYLRERRHLVSFVTERAQLRAWLHLYPSLSRWALTRDHIRSAVAKWQGQGYSAQEIKHRVHALRRLYHTLDGDGPTPCDGVRLPPIPKPRPVPVPDDLVRQVAVNLQIAEMDGIGKLRDAKTRARYLVLATTGQRPAQVKRAQPSDVDLERRVWVVRPAKGDAGTIVVLNDDMLAAWRLFRAAEAWGSFSTRSFVRTLRHNGWPNGIRPYNLRHAVGFALSGAGVDLGDIQAHMGHTDPRTTRTFYVPALLARQAAASAAIEGRLGPTAIGTARTAQNRNATIRQNAKENADRLIGGKGIDPAPKPAKLA
jgi:integrase